MSGQSHAYELLKRVSSHFHFFSPDRNQAGGDPSLDLRGLSTRSMLLVRADQIGPGGFFSRVASEKKDVWMEEETSIRKGQVLPEEERFLCSALTCLLLSEQDSFRGSLSRFFKARDFLPKRSIFSFSWRKGSEDCFGMRPFVPRPNRRF